MACLIFDSRKPQSLHYQNHLLREVTGGASIFGAAIPGGLSALIIDLRYGGGKGDESDSDVARANHLV